MKSFWTNLNSIQKTQFVAVTCVAIFLLAVAARTYPFASRDSRTAAPVRPVPSQISRPAPAAPMAARGAQSVPPTAVVDGVTYTGEQQVEALIQAGKDAGMDDDTARRTGEEAAALCNGNPECLR